MKTFSVFLVFVFYYFLSRYADMLHKWREFRYWDSRLDDLQKLIEVGVGKNEKHVDPSLVFKYTVGDLVMPTTGDFVGLECRVTGRHILYMNGTNGEPAYQVQPAYNSGGGFVDYLERNLLRL